MKTQFKETNYYVFWTVAMVAFIVPQVVTAISYHKLAEYFDKPVKVEIVNR